MKRILLAGVAACALSMSFTSPVIADEDTKTELVAEDAVPKPTDLKFLDGTNEGHKKPMDVYLKAVKAAKGGDMAALKSCFRLDDRDDLDETNSWDGGEKTYLQWMGDILKGYSEEGMVREQGKIGKYAVIAVKNGEAVNLVKVVLEGKRDEKTWEEGPRDWFLASYRPMEYRIDYNAPGVKAIRDMIDKGDVAKMKEYLEEWQTKTLDLITGAEDGVDGYALLMKRLKKITSSEAKPIFLLGRYDTALCYWFHSEESDTFLVLRFTEQQDWQTDKRHTEVKLELDKICDFHRDAGKAFRDFVGDYDW